MREIIPTEDIIDSRDVIERIDELEGQEEPLDDDEIEELAMLLDLRDECQGVDDWQYGATLVHNDYWRQYAEEWFDDVYGTPEVPEGVAAYITIDYAAFARDLRMDYMSVTFGGQTYWVR